MTEIKQPIPESEVKVRNKKREEIEQFDPDKDIIFPIPGPQKNSEMLIFTYANSKKKYELLDESNSILLRKRNLQIMFELFDKINIRHAKFPLNRGIAGTFMIRNKKCYYKENKLLNKRAS